MAPARIPDSKKNRQDKTDLAKMPRGKPSTSKQKQEKEKAETVPLVDINFNVVKQFDLLQRNGIRGSQIHRSGESIISQRLNSFSVFKIFNSFNRRVTCIAWHPCKTSFIAGSKAGDMTLFNYNSENDTFVEKFEWPGLGPGLSIMSIHYPQFMKNAFLTGSIDGTVKLWDLENNSSQPKNTLMSTGTIQRWFCSVNSCPETSSFLVGDSKGSLITIDKNLKVVSTIKIHKNKINTLEFSKRDPWTFATASTDLTVKLFDSRNVKNEIECFKHNNGVNSAYFSNTSSGRLLTTDQDCELRVYKGPVWELERTIRHPHRHFMHITPIKATWHPLADLIIAGRYPDTNSPDLRHLILRCIDVFSAETGCLKNELYSANCTGIQSLNNFSPCGEYLASAMGLYIPLWRLRNPSLKHKLSSEGNTNENSDKHDDDDDDSDLGPPKNKKSKMSDSKNTKMRGKSKA